MISIYHLLALLQPQDGLHEFEDLFGRHPHDVLCLADRKEIALGKFEVRLPIADVDVHGTLLCLKPSNHRRMTSRQSGK